MHLYYVLLGIAMYQDMLLAMWSEKGSGSLDLFVEDMISSLTSSTMAGVKEASTGFTLLYNSGV